ncbi:PREDICTED: SCP2 sterol-binding domain-containing protein 1 [Crocodylus porosus]|uniref:SCP2 sterol binding domain containing 1 n=1 Tax=Crocodylus porosus TaxID=8502 RepID=A0A7M4EVQ8_CROPO|nr:PREDICTED: SCP2 sterol-binding domain-containing protein 1 [Crocodylus porosus]
MWKEGKKIYIQSKIKEAADSSSYVTLRSASPKPSVKATGLRSDLIFEEIGHSIKQVGSQLATKVNAVFQWDITSNGKVVMQWTLDLKTGSGEIYRGASCSPADTIFILSDHDFMDLVLGKIKPQRALFVGRLKVKGNIMLGQKLVMILKDHVKLI